VNINITWDSSVSAAPAGFQSTVLAVANSFASTFSNAATVNIDVGWGEVDGSKLPSNALGESLTYFGSLSYSSLRSALKADATSAADFSSTKTLSNTAPTGGNSHWWVTTANAKALGLYSSDAIDGYVGFSSTLPFDYNDADGVTTGTYDLYGVVAHEFSEIMGRQLLVGESLGGYSKGYTALDLFHYAGKGVPIYSGTRAGYLSPDGGTTHLQSFNTSPSGDFGDWANTAGADAFRAFSPAGQVNPVTAGDVTAMDLIGWNLASVTGGAAGTVTAGVASTSTQLSAQSTDWLAALHHGGMLNVGHSLFGGTLVADLDAFVAT
jgi:hypothetical protein